MKKKKRCLLAAMLILAAYLICSAIDIWRYADIDETRHADTAIVLGAAADDAGVSPVFRERINHAVRLYQAGYVQTIILTGGYGTGNLHSDAYIGMLYAVEQGIPEQDILLEEASTITQENLVQAKALMDANGLQTALIVSDPLHMKRAMLLAENAGIEAYTSPTDTSMYRSFRTKLPFLAREVFFYVGYQLVTLL